MCFVHHGIAQCWHDWEEILRQFWKKSVGFFIFTWLYCDIFQCYWWNTFVNLNETEMLSFSLNSRHQPHCDENFVWLTCPFQCCSIMHSVISSCVGMNCFSFIYFEKCILWNDVYRSRKNGNRISQCNDCYKPVAPKLTGFNFNPSMDKQSHVLQNVGWNYLSNPKLQRCNRWSLGMGR